MKRHYYNSLSHFYGDIKNIIGATEFNKEAKQEDRKFRGLYLSEIQESKYAYKLGVEKLRAYKDFEVQKDIKVKYWDQFDGHDIDIDRMQDNLDFLLNDKKIRKLPKTMDIFVNVTENSNVSYTEMLNKTYAALKIIDRLETLGVRTALFVCICVSPLVKGMYTEDVYIEICVKQHADTVNLGALCTAISPWFFRFWFILWIRGRYAGLDLSVGAARPIPSSEKQKGITIDKGNCLSTHTANNFIESIKVESCLKQ